MTTTITPFYLQNQLGEVPVGTCINIMSVDVDDRTFVLRNIAVNIAHAIHNLEEQGIVAYFTSSQSVKQALRHCIPDTQYLSVHFSALREHTPEAMIETLADLEQPGKLMYVIVEEIDRYFVEGDVMQNVRALRRAAANGEFILITTSSMRPEAAVLLDTIGETEEYLETVGNGAYSLRGLDMEYDVVICTEPDSLQITENLVTHNVVVKHRAVESAAGKLTEFTFRM